MDSPSVSDSRMNSWRLSSVISPVRVRKSMPWNHSASVSFTSRAKACRCCTRLVRISFSRGSGVSAKRAITAWVMLSWVRLRMQVSWVATLGGGHNLEKPGTANEFSAARKDRRRVPLDRWTEMALFVQVAETGSLSRAAEELGLSNAAASRHLAALEERLGARLVERNTRRLYLTEPGQEFLRRSKQI